MFDGKEPSRGINPDEAVAYGAAIQGDILGGGTVGKTVVLDVIALSQVSQPGPSACVFARRCAVKKWVAVILFMMS